MPPSMPKPPPLVPSSPPKAYALRFISGKYQGGEFPLPVEGEIVIGRSSELDVVLVEDMVSRRHSKITVRSGEMFIQDLGSTNGTFVNGEKVQHARLQEGDRILVGTNIIKVVALQRPETSDAEAVRAEMARVDAQRRPSGQVRTLTGDLSEVPLPDLLQLFGASRKSGCLVVTTERDQATVHLEQGNVVYTEIEGRLGLDPQEAFFQVVTWSEGSFELLPPARHSFPARIEMGTEALLMEAMRRMDEANRQSERLPRDASMSLPLPLEPPLRALGPEQLDLLQQALNSDSVGQLLEACAQPETEVLASLADLVERGYLRLDSDRL